MSMIMLADSNPIFRSGMHCWSASFQDSRILHVENWPKAAHHICEKAGHRHAIADGDRGCQARDAVNLAVIAADLGTVDGIACADARTDDRDPPLTGGFGAHGCEYRGMDGDTAGGGPAGNSAFPCHMLHRS